LTLTYAVLLNPLTPEEAFWHASSGTPYEEVREDQELRYDQLAVGSGLWWISGLDGIRLVKPGDRLD
jgi:hypothetical protein